MKTMKHFSLLVDVKLFTEWLALEKGKENLSAEEIKKEIIKYVEGKFKEDNIVGFLYEEGKIC